MGNCHFLVNGKNGETCKLFYLFRSASFVLFFLGWVALSRTNFIFDNVIGKGGFGKVWKVERKKTRTCFAMKEMAKAK